MGGLLDIEGSHSEIVWVTRGIAAGSGLATVQLTVLQLDFTDTCVSSSIYSQPTLYVDAATVETICKAAHIFSEHGKATSTFAYELKDIGLISFDTSRVCSKASLSRLLIGRCRWDL